MRRSPPAGTWVLLAGTWQTQSTNPVLVWSTLLIQPMIRAEMIFSLCNQGIGHLVEQIDDAAEHETSLEGRIERAFGTPCRLIRAAFAHAGHAPRTDAVGPFVVASSSPCWPLGSHTSSTGSNGN